VRRLENLVEKLQRIPGRTIFRPTVQYFSALQRSFAPSLLRSTSARRIFLQEACRPGAGSRILAQEIESLADTDIPVFENRNVKIELDFSDASLERSISVIGGVLG